MLARQRLAGNAAVAGKHESQPRMQANWYALGRRALMNADSYAQFILVATGAQAPRA